MIDLLQFGALGIVAYIVYNQQTNTNKILRELRDVIIDLKVYLKERNK